MDVKQLLSVKNDESVPLAKEITLSKQPDYFSSLSSELILNIAERVSLQDSCSLSHTSSFFQQFITNYRAHLCNQVIRSDPMLSVAAASLSCEVDKGWLLPTHPIFADSEEIVCRLREPRMLDGNPLFLLWLARFLYSDREIWVDSIEEVELHHFTVFLSRMDMFCKGQRGLDVKKLDPRFARRVSELVDSTDSSAAPTAAGPTAIVSSQNSAQTTTALPTTNAASTVPHVLTTNAAVATNASSMPNHVANPNAATTTKLARGAERLRKFMELADLIEDYMDTTTGWIEEHLLEWLRDEINSLRLRVRLRVR